MLSRHCRDSVAGETQMSSLERLDIFPKTFDDFKERTLGGALISIVCCLLALCLFTAEFAQYRAVETVDRLDVDTRTAANSKLSINLDVLLPSLPCDEIVMDVVDESGSEQLAVTNTLHKLRVDRHGVPIDTPEAVDWSHTLAPAFHQRKVIQLMDDAHLHLAETLGHLQHEEEENPSLNAEGHEAHREELTTQAALLQGRLAHLTAVAEEAEHAEVVGDAAHQEHLAMTTQEVEALHASITESQAYSDEQREQVLPPLTPPLPPLTTPCLPLPPLATPCHPLAPSHGCSPTCTQGATVPYPTPRMYYTQVLSNLHAMSRNLNRLQSMGPTEEKTAANLREALRIRLSILQVAAYQPLHLSAVLPAGYHPYLPLSSHLSSPSSLQVAGYLPIHPSRTTSLVSSLRRTSIAATSAPPRTARTPHSPHPAPRTPRRRAAPPRPPPPSLPPSRLRWPAPHPLLQPGGEHWGRVARWLRAA